MNLFGWDIEVKKNKIERFDKYTKKNSWFTNLVVEKLRVA